MPTLAVALLEKGWTVHTPNGAFTKGDWELDFDTSHWMIVSSRANPRVFDIPSPDEYHAGWTVNLIEHLCRMEDERTRLWKALGLIRDTPTADDAVRGVAAEALADCYHSWLVNVEVPEGKPGRMFCPICGRRAAQAEAEPSASADPPSPSL